MRVPISFIVGLSFAAAAGLSLLAASASVGVIEDLSEISVREALDTKELTWAEVQADGLQVTLSGTAPTEASRFQALTVAGSVVDAARVIDEMDVEAIAALAPPRFSVEILRNTSGVSVIGLIPQSENRDDLLKRFNGLESGPVTDLLEVADHAPPAGWEDAMSFALNAIRILPRAKVSISAGRVSIQSIAKSAEAKRRIESRLMRDAPPGLTVALAIKAPRPVITPFTLRFVIDEEGARFDACSAATADGQARILTAAAQAGAGGPNRCTIGMGVPSPHWPQAAETAIAALAQLGRGSVTFSDADVTLVAAQGTPQADFDRIIGELETNLPEVFALHASLPAPEMAGTAGPPEFIATLSPEGQVQLRGRISDDALRNLVQSFAQARFGSEHVYMAARIVPDLPNDWGPRVLSGLDALSNLSNGAVTVTPDRVVISGATGNPEANAEISRLLADTLGEVAEFEIDVSYKEVLDPVANLPTPEECVAQVATVLAQGKINFEPGSATIDASALPTMDAIAEILKECADIPLEIQGHTDSQGREEMNQALSQARAQSVLNELRARRVLTGTFIAEGFGETRPIADNSTEEGREANRRIEFHLVGPADPAKTIGTQQGDRSAQDPEGSSDEQN
jgi:OOP family OmpA-OmpF porin